MSAAPFSDARPSRIYIVTLNWNGWSNTIECLESLTHLVGVEWTAVVADNASSDGSATKIQAWANGQQEAVRTPFLGQEPCAKPYPFVTVDPVNVDRALDGSAKLVLIETGDNLGFAGGCNVGIRFALAQPDCAYVWLLNNDCVVDPDSLRAMVDLCRARERVGQCGSQIRYYHKPTIVQTFGGLFNRWLCTVHNIACGVPSDALPPDPTHLDYIPGASILVTREFIQRVGLLCEDYFLYFEEPDWAERGKGTFELAVSRSSIVYHRGGSSIGTPGETSPRGLRSDYFMLRARAIFARKFYPFRLPVVYIGLLASMATRLRRRRWSNALVAACVVLGLTPGWLKLPPQAQKRIH